MAIDSRSNGSNIGSGSSVSAYGPVAAGVGLIDPAHLDTDLLRISLGITIAAHVLVVIGGPVHGHPALGPQERDAAAVAAKYI